MICKPKADRSRCSQLLQFTKPKVYRNQKQKIAVRSLGPYQEAKLFLTHSFIGLGKF